MNTHRRTQHKVSKEAENNNFDPGTALENLRAEVVDIEALVRTAEAAAEALPTPATDRQRVVFGRIQSLATKASEQASASLRFANAQATALEASMEARRKSGNSLSTSPVASWPAFDGGGAARLSPAGRQTGSKVGPTAMMPSDADWRRPLKTQRLPTFALVVTVEVTRLARAAACTVEIACAPLSSSESQTSNP